MVGDVADPGSAGGPVAAVAAAPYSKEIADAGECSGGCGVVDAEEESARALLAKRKPT